MNIRKVFSITLTSISIMICAAQTNSAASTQKLLPLAKDPSPKVASANTPIKAMRTRCYTDVADCAGYPVYGKQPQEMSCTIWWNNGQNGYTNFRVRANELISPYYVRYNDTGACVWSNQGPPDGTRRYYLYVP